MSSLAGQTFAGYEIISQLGRGGMGSVYKARQSKLNRLAALKIMASELAADPDFVARFKREATAAASLSHPNVVQVYSAGESEGTHYIAMEFVDGETLKQHIERQGRLDPREALAITVYVAEALQYGWNRARLIHRDIKPDNIFLSNTGEVKVGDLGLAKIVGGATTSLTQTGMMMGSPHYISPEQARGVSDIDFRTDIYSLGCTLYHMLTGRPPYEGTDSLAVITRHVNDPPPAIFKVWPTCPIPVALLVGKMLAKQRHERPASYEDLIDQLREVHGKLKPATAAPAVAGGQPKATPTPSPTPAHAQPTPKPAVAKPTTPRKPPATKGQSAVGHWKWAMGGLAGMVTLALVAGAVWWFAGRSPSRNDGAAVEAPPGQKNAVTPPKFGTLFDGRDTSAWQHPDGSPCQWQVTDGALVAGERDLDTREKFQDFDLHIEFAVPRDAKQGNSGIYLQGRYEVQILDSFGKRADDICCGAIFKIKAPIENVSKPPDEWQSFDITFHAARFDAAGAKTVNARVSVIHNGRLIHDNFEISKSTGKGEPESAAPGPIRLQAYGSPVRFRNIRIAPAKTIELSNRDNTAAATPGTGWKNAIDLLSLVDISQDANTGQWKTGPDGIVATDIKNMSQKIQPPYRPPEEYDYRVSFTPTGGNADVAIGLTAKGRSFVFYMKKYATDHCLGFEAISGKAIAHGPTAHRFPHLEKGRQYTVVVEVRKNGLRGYLDGKLVTEWATDYSDMGAWPVWKFKDDTLPGFGCSLSTVVFHEAKLREVTGKGMFTRGAH